MSRFLIGTMSGCLLGGLLFTVLQGPWAHGDQAPTGYSLEDVYQYIATNGADVPVEGGHPLGPTAAPGQGDPHTLADIMAALRERFPCRQDPGCVLPATGQDKSYDLTKVVDPSVYPGQDGFYQAGCPKEERFVDNGDGTVTDRCTGLMWLKAGTTTTTDFFSAVSYCEGLVFAGHNDWRLPNAFELQSLIDYGRSAPTIDPIFVVKAAKHWSSTNIYIGQNPIVADFSTGRCDVHPISGVFAYALVLAVRDAD